MEIFGIVFGIMGIVCFGIAIYLFIQMKNERIRYLELKNKEQKGPCSSYRRGNWPINFSKRIKTSYRKYNSDSYCC